MSDQEKDCMYCMQEMTKEQDPRKLPCGHVFCLICMKADSSSRGITGHQCATCRVVHEQINFDSLPSGVADEIEKTEDSDLVAAAAGMRCDRCKDQKPAVTYCIDCGEKSCAHHMEHHEGYYEGLHETLDIMKYAENPSLYNKAITCIHHKKECITMACKTCYQYNCVRCENTASLLCQDEHVYLPLAKIEQRIKSDFDVLLKKVSDKLVQIAKIEKKAWDRYDKLRVSCKDMIAQVERKSCEQIEQVQAQTEQLKQAIQLYETEKTDQCVKFVTELMKKKDEIEEVRMSTHRFLRNKHVTELIKCKDEKTSVLERANSTVLGKCEWTDKSLRIGKTVQMQVLFRERRSVGTGLWSATRYDMEDF